MLKYFRQPFQKKKRKKDGAALLTMDHTTSCSKSSLFYHRCRLHPSPPTATYAIMPATTLFDRADFDSVIRTTTSSSASMEAATPVKGTNGTTAAVALPHDVSPSASSVGSDDDDMTSLTGVIGTLQLSSGSSRSSVNIAPSEHKIAENEGRHAIEPLLKDNPNRFVLFPIQDNDVSLV